MITGKYFRYWTHCEETEDLCLTIYLVELKFFYDVGARTHSTKGMLQDVRWDDSI